MDSEILNIIKVCSSVISSICFCYFVCLKIPKGMYRLVSVLPIIYNFTVIPRYLSSPLAIGHATFYFTWIANFKLVLFAFNMGPLSMDPPKSFPLFLTIASLPVSVNRRKIIPKPKKIPLNLPIEILALTAFFATLGDFKHNVSPFIMLVLYSVTLFFKINVTVGIWSKVAQSVTGLEMLPASDEPYLSSSLQDFWGRRWNLAVTRTLRDTVYNPVLTATAAVLGEEGGKVVAILTTFLVSGLMHEVLLYNATGENPSWEMVSYFVLQGVCLIVELRLKKVCADRWRLSVILAAPLSVGFVVGTAYFMFFPALLRKRVFTLLFRDFWDLVWFCSKSVLNFLEF